MENKRKIRIGTVISSKMDQTVVVSIEKLTHHKLYRKTIKHIVKYKAHNKNNESKEGDIVKIIETRPLSKEKRWRVAQIVKKGESVEVKPVEVT
jgi:small subunit ribosomal protein S17